MKPTRLVAPPHYELPEGALPTGFSYRLANRRIGIVLKGEEALIQFRRLLTPQEAAAIGPAWADRICETRLRLSIEALACISHFIHHLEAPGHATASVPQPVLVYRPAPPLSTISGTNFPT